MRESSNAWFTGEGSLLVQAAETWLQYGHTIVGIASSEPLVLTWAAHHDIQIVDSSGLFEAAQRAPFDYLFSIVNFTLLGDQVLRLPVKLAVNFHDSHLPRYAGINATVWALLAGEKSHGVTWHEMTATADAGRILVQGTVGISADETAFSLNAKCFAAGIDTFRELTERITEQTLAPISQNLAERTYFGFYERPPALSVLRLDDEAESLARSVRALDFGPYPNAIATPKLLLERAFFIVSTAEVLEGRSGASPGTVLLVTGDTIVVATGSNDMKLVLRAPSGAALDSETIATFGLRDGVVIPSLDEPTRTLFTELGAQAAKSEGFFLKRLLQPLPLVLSLGTPNEQEPLRVLDVEVEVPLTLAENRLPALVLTFLARQTGIYHYDVRYSDPLVRQKSGWAPALFASDVPLRIVLDPAASLGAALTAIGEAQASTSSRFPYLLDLPARHPKAPRAPLPVAVLVNVRPATELPEGSMTLLIDTEKGSVHFTARSDRVDASRLEALAGRLGVFLARALADEHKPLGRVPLVSANEERKILTEWNATAREIPEHECAHTLFEAQVRRTPDAIAVTAQGRSLSYRELDRRANALAHVLHERGVRPDMLVGVFLDRSVNMMVAVFGIQKAGGAYVPLDPHYPKDRIQFMIGDAELGIIVTDKGNHASLPESLTRVSVDDVQFDLGADAPPESDVESTHLAYIIYTSGSTGKPKGVMVEHQNVVNFFHAMDDVLAPEAPGTWLAVTSLSFDISVLELCWTLTRGFHVVIFSGQWGAAAALARPIDFSLFYFSSDASGGGPEHYRLLLDGARFADEHDFVAVWTPERHFHAFGGLYPNPAVTSAALAMITTRVALRAGSCVSPLHSPLRLAEEWSLVDNLSNGRVGISFASGWQPNDFCIRPDAFERRREQMYEDIDTVRRLWRGEQLPFKNGNGKEVAISILPRPVQQELPVWITAAGNPETFEGAGRIGANLLTHLLGQTFAELEQKILAYRSAWEKAGHAGRGTVTLMLHAFVGSSDAEVKEAVRQPMKEYLRSAVGLIKEAAWSFPTFKNKAALEAGTFSTDGLNPEDMDALLDHAFERYYQTSGLFGSVETALQTVDQVKRIDVDEIACLVDFGIGTDQVLSHLPLLARVRELSNRTGTGQSESIGALLEEHRVTHLQCTPSMASMLVLDQENRAGLSELSAMLVGGEALPVGLATELRRLVPGSLINVYGPTETTVWSSSHRIDSIDGDVCIGRPLANTEILILDSTGALVPPGSDGELVIGGKGVARGYLGAPELTRERFVDHPIREGGRVYRTGDLACFDESGVLHFKGRLDNQVKIRGHRVELGEIEARLGEHVAVRECIVLAREDTPGDRRLVAYVIARDTVPAPAELRSHLKARLPEYMLPEAFVFTPAFPQTPNRKIDRKALLANGAEVVVSLQSQIKEAARSPRSALEEAIAGTWQETLNVRSVGLVDNFFDLGGHSLLMLQVLGSLKTKVARPLTLLDLFRYPTIRSLATYLESATSAAGHLDEGAARGAERQRFRQAVMNRHRGP